MNKHKFTALLTAVLISLSLPSCTLDVNTSRAQSESEKSSSTSSRSSSSSKADPPADPLEAFETKYSDKAYLIDSIEGGDHFCAASGKNGIAVNVRSYDTAYGDESGGRCYILSLETGKKTDFKNGQMVCCADGLFRIFNQKTYAIETYSSEGKVIDTFELNSDDLPSDVSTEYLVANLDRYDGSTLWLTSAKEHDGLWKTTVFMIAKGGKSEQFEVDGNLTFEGAGRECVYFSCFSADYTQLFSFGKSTHQFTEITDIDYYDVLDAEYFDLCPGSTILTGPIEGGGNRLITRLKKTSNGEASSFRTEDFFFTNEQTDSAQIIRAYDLKNGLCYDPLLLPKDTYIVGSSCFEDGVVISIQDETLENCELLYWDFKASGEHSATVSTFSEQELDAENNRLSASLSREFGIDIYIYDQSDDFVVIDYTGEAFYKPMKTNILLMTIDDILSCFPDGMIEKMSEGEFDRLKIYLSSKLRAIGDEYVAEAAGVVFTSYSGDITVKNMLLDAEQDASSLKSTIAHEFSHIIDSRFQKLEFDTGICYSSFWTTLNPPDSDYFYRYTDYFDDTNTEYDVNSYTDENVVYYIDSYAKTYQTEDIARIFEQLFSDDYDTSLDYPHIMDKAAYLCAVIRECYDIPDSEELYWERYVDTVDFDEYADDIAAFAKTSVG